MQPTTQQATPRPLLERPDTPAQWYGAVAGVFLLALGILSLIFEARDFGSVGSVGDQPQFIIWAVSGWTSIFWIAMGGLGLMALTRLEAARTYALAAGVVFAVVAIWGFISGDSAFWIFAADTTNNITHAILAVLGLMAGMLPRTTQRPAEETAAGRFSRTEQPEAARADPLAGRD